MRLRSQYAVFTDGVIAFGYAWTETTRDVTSVVASAVKQTELASLHVDADRIDDVVKEPYVDEIDLHDRLEAITQEHNQ